MFAFVPRGHPTEMDLPCLQPPIYRITFYFVLRRLSQLSESDSIHE